MGSMENIPKNLQRIGMLVFYTGSETHASVCRWTPISNFSQAQCAGARSPWMTESEPTGLFLPLNIERAPFSGLIQFFFLLVNKACCLLQCVSRSYFGQRKLIMILFPYIFLPVSLNLRQIVRLAMKDGYVYKNHKKTSHPAQCFQQSFPITLIILSE